MTLFKQIALLLSVFFTILLLTVLTINFKYVSKSISERLYEDAKNTASSLSLSLGSANGDISMITIMINANFDSGHYGFISLINQENKILYQKKAQLETVDVPTWFINAIELEAPIASANVSAGWNPVGILNVQSNVSYAYEELYDILKNMSIAFMLIIIIGLIILNALLIIILKPLKKVQLQATAIIKNEFIIENTDIFTKEFKDVVIGMNTMVAKAKAMFDKGNEQLQRQRELEYTDKVTKLKNRKYFMHKLPEYLKIDATSKGGIIIIIEIEGLEEANEIVGHKNINKLLIDIADVLNDYSYQHQHAILARMNSSQSFLLIPDLSHEDGIILVDGIESFIQDIIKEKEVDNITALSVSIGLSEYSSKDKLGVLLARADSALIHSKFLKNNKLLQKVENVTEIMNSEEWKEVLNKAIKNSSFSFVSSNVIDVKAKSIVHNVLSFSLHVNDELKYDYSQFILPANQLKLSNKIYELILNKMFKTPDISLINTISSLKLSYDYLSLDSTFQSMSKLFSKYASNLPFKLIIEIPDKLVRKNSQEVKKYKMLFEEYGIEVGVGEFMGENKSYDYLRDLRPLYIKAEKNYYIEQNEQFLSALRLITDSVNISLIATEVYSIKTLSELSEKEIYIIQGEVTKAVTI